MKILNTYTVEAFKTEIKNVYEDACNDGQAAYRKWFEYVSKIATDGVFIIDAKLVKNLHRYAMAIADEPVSYIFDYKRIDVNLRASLLYHYVNKDFGKLYDVEGGVDHPSRFLDHAFLLEIGTEAEAIKYIDDRLTPRIAAAVARDVVTDPRLLPLVKDPEAVFDIDFDAKNYLTAASEYLSTCHLSELELKRIKNRVISRMVEHRPKELAEMLISTGRFFDSGFGDILYIRKDKFELISSLIEAADIKLANLSIAATESILGERLNYLLLDKHYGGETLSLEPLVAVSLNISEKVDLPKDNWITTLSAKEVSAIFNDTVEVSAVDLVSGNYDVDSDAVILTELPSNIALNAYFVKEVLPIINRVPKVNGLVIANANLGSKHGNLIELVGGNVTLATYDSKKRAYDGSQLKQYESKVTDYVTLSKDSSTSPFMLNETNRLILDSLARMQSEIKETFALRRPARITLGMGDSIEGVFRRPNMQLAALKHSVNYFKTKHLDNEEAETSKCPLLMDMKFTPYPVSVHYYTPKDEALNLGGILPNFGLDKLMPSTDLLKHGFVTQQASGYGRARLFGRGNSMPSYFADSLSTL